MRRWLSFASTALAIILSTLKAGAAPGDLDPSFDGGSCVDGPVLSIAVQPDSKIVIGGLFTRVKGWRRYNIARLNADGTGDPSFDCGYDHWNYLSPNGAVDTVAVQPDGKI